MKSHGKCQLKLNHSQPEDMEWLRAWGRKEIPNLVRRGPENGVETNYSFDYQQAHFVVINQYYDGKSDTGTNGDVSEALYKWLERDLIENRKPITFVVGHEPMVSMPDYDNGRHRHQGDNLDAHPENSHRFQKLLRQHNVAAYLCGHTHDFSCAKINSIWQLDVGHCRGIGDKGAPSTFVKIFVKNTSCWAEVYRDDCKGGAYKLNHTIQLN